ncbi:CRE-CTBP-1 protein [Caenorhabditis remanei]|uniref:CRE-CTBP-1 protein n=1 Tax=Caenorhabditis remanei TaxID=31234 RepID=E3LDT9_CAERE|nr:CRE-CTBP-1 protein [Caenorhabditis remanei]
MPTTCGFPNCKFRSRYRGLEDNRHFYRIPKRPLILRQRWLTAIGRTEETVVSQLRICSAHFEGGEKKEGDIPVPDPTVDKQIKIELPPKESKNSDRRRKQNIPNRFSRPESPSGDSPSYSKKSRSFRDFYPSLSSTPSFDPAQSPQTPHQQVLPDPQQALNDILSMTNTRMNGPSSSRPLVALLDGRDCSVEMPILKDVATVAFCDAQSTQEIHEKVLNEAVAALMYHSIKLEKEDLEKFKVLKVVFRIGYGIDNIDVKAATELGIAVCHAPGDYVEDVADSTLSLILDLFRRTYWHAKSYTETRKVFSSNSLDFSTKTVQTIGADQVRENAVGSKKVRGSVLGVLGCGRVGTAVGLRAKAFGLHVIFYDPFVRDGHDKALGFERYKLNFVVLNNYGLFRVSSLDEFMSRSDCISLHCNLGDETRGIISADTLRQCKPGIFIVNTSHAGLIIENDLAAALKSGHVKGAALDVHDSVRFDPNCLNPLIGCPNIINTPHSAWMTESACKELRIQAAKEIRKAINGRCPQDLTHCINKEAVMRNNNPINRRTSAAHPLLNMGFPGLPNFPPMSMSPHFPYPNPLLAMGAQMGALNPFMGNGSLPFNPAAALSSLAAAQAANAQRGSPANRSSRSSPSPQTNKSSVSPSNNGFVKTEPSSPAPKIEVEIAETDKQSMMTFLQRLIGPNGDSSASTADSGIEGGDKEKVQSDGDENMEDMEVIDAEKLKEELNIGQLTEPEEISVGLNNGNRINIDEPALAT